MLYTTRRRDVITNMACLILMKTLLSLCASSHELDWDTAVLSVPKDLSRIEVEWRRSTGKKR